jgi:rubrerythrin
MKFIPKTGLVEGMAANPLDKAVAEDQDVTALAQEGILTAAAAETDAINQYSQILELVGRSEPWLGNLVKPTLEDIVSEEKKHFAQLSTIVSKLPAFEEEFKAGTEEAETGEDKEEPKENTTEEKEEVEESVVVKSSEEYNKYDLDTIIKIITEETSMSSDYLYDHADAYNYIESDGLYPQQVDDFLALFTFNPETLERIEKRVVEEADVEKNKKADNIDSINSDIRTLENLLDEGLFSQEAREEVQKAIDNLNVLIAE